MEGGVEDRRERQRCEGNGARSGKRAFVLGRRNRRATEVVLVARRRPPLTGPWTLRAVVSAN